MLRQAYVVLIERWVSLTQRAERWVSHIHNIKWCQDKWICGINELSEQTTEYPPSAVFCCASPLVFQKAHRGREHASNITQNVIMNLPRKWMIACWKISKACSHPPSVFLKKTRGEIQLKSARTRATLICQLSIRRADRCT